MNDDPARWAELGYCVFPALFGDAEVAAMRVAYAAAEPQGGRFRDPGYPLAEPHTRRGPWLEVCRHPLLLDAVASVLGPDLVLVYSSFFTKPEDGRLAPGGDELAVVSFHQVL
jgi:hypothetical protein